MLDQANSVVNPINEQVQEKRHLMKGPDKEIWFRLLVNEFGRLAQGVGTIIKRTKTLTFIPKREVPFAKNVTYGRIVCDNQTNKSEIHRSILMVCRNFLDFEGALSTPTDTITTTNLMVNNIIFTKTKKYYV